MKDATHFVEFYKDIRTGKMLRSPEPQKIKFLAWSLKITADSKTLKTIFVMKGKMKPGYEHLLNPILITGDTVNGSEILIVEPIK